ncbi:hypothetical protein [Halomonas sp. PA16-9]|uniref:hypothetical protein n=1 Tax=Halomonas sp. PA16-9 TaxID=2576841 RepID=UPI0030EC23AF
MENSPHAHPTPPHLNATARFAGCIATQRPSKRRHLASTPRRRLGDSHAPPPWLDSFFRGRGDQASITQTAQEQIAAWQGSGNLLLVTYQVNITALMGGGVGSGEMIVVRPMDESLQVVGRLSVSGQ